MMDVCCPEIGGGDIEKKEKMDNTSFEISQHSLSYLRPRERPFISPWARL